MAFMEEKPRVEGSRTQSARQKPEPREVRDTVALLGREMAGTPLAGKRGGRHKAMREGRIIRRDRANQFV